MKFVVYLALDEDGEWSAAGSSEHHTVQIVTDWNLAENYSAARIYRVEIDAPAIPMKAEVIKVVGFGIPATEPENGT